MVYKIFYISCGSIYPITPLLKDGIDPEFNSQEEASNYLSRLINRYGFNYPKVTFIVLPIIGIYLK